MRDRDELRWSVLLTMDDRQMQRTPSRTEYGPLRVLCPFRVKARSVREMVNSEQTWEAARLTKVKSAKGSEEGQTQSQNLGRFGLASALLCSRNLRRNSMPYVTVSKENSGDIDLYYEDHGAVTP